MKWNLFSQLKLITVKGYTPQTLSSPLHQWMDKKKMIETIFTFCSYHGLHKLVGGIPTPLNNDGVRQFGWWNSQLNGNYNAMFQTTNQQIWYNVIELTWTCYPRCFWSFQQKKSPKRQLVLTCSNPRQQVQPGGQHNQGFKSAVCGFTFRLTREFSGDDEIHFTFYWILDF